MVDSGRKWEDIGRETPAINISLFPALPCESSLALSPSFLGFSYQPPWFQLLLGDPGPQAQVYHLLPLSLQPWCVREFQLLLILGYFAVTC